MEKRRKLIRQINFLIMFLIFIFYLMGKSSIGTSLLIIFLFGNTVRLVLKKANEKQQFNQRAYLLTFVMIIFFGLLGLRLFQIQIVKHGKFEKMAKSQSYGRYFLRGKRGKILDSTGKELAYDIDIYKVIIDPVRFYPLPDKEKVISEINQVQPITLENLDERLKDGFERKKRYIKIIKKINEIDKSKIDVILSKYGIKSNEVYYEHSTERKYIAYDEVAPIVGFMGAFSQDEDRRKGAYGIERFYDEYLKKRKIEKDGYYTNLRTLLLPMSKKENNVVQKDGDDITLTVDYYIQYILDDEMMKQYKKVEPKSAVGIIMDPTNGKIIAMSSYPRTSNIAYLNNRAIRSQYEVGSIFKPLVMAAAYEEGVVNDDSRFSNPDGFITRYGHKIRDSDKHAIGMISPQTIIKESSNVGMSLISEELDAATYEKYLRQYNLYSKTGIDIFGELAPRQLPHEKWDGMRKYTMSFGQGIAITPLQTIAALASTINGGIYYKPYIVDRVTTPEGITIRKNIPIAKRRVISEKTSKKIREMLKLTVEEGTGKNGSIEGYSIGGKTGTAQLSSRGGYLHHEYLASFVGVFPAEYPKYIMLIMFEKPKADVYYKKFGAWVAAPVFKNVLDRIIKYKEITPENVDKLRDTENPLKITENIDIEILPNFKNDGIRYALLVANKYNIDISIEGQGEVVEQDPKPGTNLKDVKKIKIKLR